MSSSSTDKSLWIGGCCDVSTTLTFNFDLVSDPIDNISTYCTTTTSGNTNDLTNGNGGKIGGYSYHGNNNHHNNNNNNDNNNNNNDNQSSSYTYVQTCFAYTVIEKNDNNGEWMVCRRLCVMTKAFPLATDCERVTASTDLEALSVVSIVCLLVC